MNQMAKGEIIRHDVVRELQKLQEFEDQPLEMQKYVNLESDKC
jgi:hypothetical protein